MTPQGGAGGRGGGSTTDTAASLAKAADALVAMMDAKGVGTALIVTVPMHKLSVEQNYELFRDAVARHPDRLRQMAGGATLKSMLQDIPAEKVTQAHRDAFRKQANRLIDDGAVGFGEMISLHLCMTENHSFQIAPADHPLFMELADVAAERNVAIDLHMEAVETRMPTPANLKRACSKNPDYLELSVPALERLLAHNRNARVVWQHIGWDNTGGMTPDLLSRLLDRHPNLFMALRFQTRTNQGGGQGAFRILDKATGRIKADWLAFVERYPDRLVLGADEFVGPAGSPNVAASFHGTWSMVEQLPAALAAKIGGANARRIYILR